MIRRGELLTKCRDGSTLFVDSNLYSNIVNAMDYVSVDCFGSGFLVDGLIELVRVDGDWVFKLPGGIRIIAGDYFYTIYETWILGIHFLGFDLRDWVVVDVGSFIGDTPLYYASKGAFVIALEPVPRHYEIMLRNLSLNPGLASRVLPINAALSGVDGYVDIAVTSQIDGVASMFKDGLRHRVKSFTLSTLLKHIEDQGIDISKSRVRALKMDCKGCEYDVVNDESIRVFDVLKIEYSGYLRGATVEPLIRRLDEVGFVCEMFKHNPYIGLSLKTHGTLRCIRGK